jgi:hypothetical protein
MAEQLEATLAKVAKNYRSLLGTLNSVRGTLENIERRTMPIGEDGDEAAAAIARSGLRSIDDTLAKLEVL